MQPRIDNRGEVLFTLEILSSAVFIETFKSPELQAQIFEYNLSSLYCELRITEICSNPHLEDSLQISSDHLEIERAIRPKDGESEVDHRLSDQTDVNGRARKQYERDTAQRKGKRTVAEDQAAGRS